MARSRCLGHQPSESQVGKSPSFLAAFHGRTLPLGRQSELSEANKNKDGCACEDIYFLCIFTTLVILKLILNALTHLITLQFYSGHQFIESIESHKIMSQLQLVRLVWNTPSSAML